MARSPTEKPDLAGFPGDLCARYRPHRRLGAGAMGLVFEAEDVELSRLVAIKVLKGMGDEPEALARFAREAQSLARVESPHVVRLYDFGTAGSAPFLVLELLAGTTLAAPGRVPFAPGACAEALELMLPVARGLSAVHAAGLVHRDVKPANVMLVPGRGPVLVDFGLVRIRTSDLTRTGAVVGTLQFLSPEGLRGHPAEVAADWWSWGASLFWLLEGVHAYEVGELLDAGPRQPLRPLRLARTDPASKLAEVLRACLALDPAGRPADCGASEALLETRSPPRPPAPERVPGSQPSGPLSRSSFPGPASRPGPPARRSRLVPGLAALVAAGLLGAWLRQARPQAEAPAAGPGGAEESDAAERLREAVARVSDFHRDPAGKLLFAGGKGYRALVDRFSSRVDDPRLLPQWTRLGRELAAWAALRRGTRGPDSPFDEALVDSYELPLAFAAVEEQLGEFLEYEGVRSFKLRFVDLDLARTTETTVPFDRVRFRSQKTALAGELAKALGPPAAGLDGEPAWLALRATLAGLFDEAGADRLVPAIDRALARPGPGRARAALFRARLAVVRDSQTLPNGAQGEEAWRLLAEPLAELPGLLVALPPVERTLLTGFLVLRWFPIAHYAGRNLRKEDCLLLGQLLTACEAQVGAAPNLAEALLRPALAYADLLDVSQKLEDPIDPYRARIKALADRAAGLTPGAGSSGP